MRPSPFSTEASNSAYRQRLARCLHVGHRLLDEIVKGEHCQDRVENVRRADAGDLDQAFCIGGSRKVGIDDGDLVAVAHVIQHGQKFAGQQRVDVLQHGLVSQQPR